MTVSIETNVAGPYVGDASTTSFAFTYKVFAAADIAVTLRNTTTKSIETLVYGTDYSVALNDDQNATPGGSITYPVSGDPLAANETLTITREVDLTQATEITNLGGFYPEVIENVADRLTMMVQQHETDITDVESRAVRAPTSDASPSMVLPAAATRAGKYLRFTDPGGDVELVDVTASTTVLSQSVIGSFLYPDTDAEIANGVTVTNPFYKPGYVNRYGTNTMPGTTDMTTAAQAAGDSGEKTIVFSGEDYLVSKTSLFTTEFPNGDQPCIFLKDKTDVVIRGEAGARIIVAEHAQGIIEMQGCVDCEVIGIELVGPTDFPDLDGSTGTGEKGDATNGYDTDSYWDNKKNNSYDTSGFSGGGFGGAFPQYAGDTAATWGTWNDGYIGNVGIGLLIQKGCKRVTVRNCKASGFNGSGFQVGFRGDSTYTENENIRFLDNYAATNFNNGVASLAVDGLLVRGNTLSGIGHPDATPATDTYPAAGYGYSATGVATYYTKNAIVEGNLVEDCVRKGLDTHASDGMQFIGNTIRNCAGMAISVPWTNSTQPVKNTVVKGNRISLCGYSPVNLSVIIGGGPIDAEYSYANSICDLVIDGNIMEDCGDNYIEIKNGRNIQITNNVMRGFDDRASGSKYFMFLGRVSTNEPIYNMNVSGNVCDADGDASMYRGISVRYAHNSQVNHNMVYLDHASASSGLELHQCGIVQSFGNTVYVDSGATTSVPLNLQATDGLTAYNWSDPDVGANNYPLANETTSGAKELPYRVPHIIQLDITFNGTTSPSYTVNAGSDYVDTVTELATYGAQVTFKNIQATALLKSSMQNVSADGLEAAAGDITFIYERAISDTALEIGLKTNASGTDIIASNCTGGILAVTIFVY